MYRFLLFVSYFSQSSFLFLIIVEQMLDILCEKNVETLMASPCLMWLFILFELLGKINNKLRNVTSWQKDDTSVNIGGTFMLPPHSSCLSISML